MNRLRHAAAACALVLLGTTACSDDDPPAGAPVSPEPSASTAAAAAPRPDFVTCPNGQRTSVVLDFEPSRDPRDTLEKSLAGYLAFQRDKQPVPAEWYAKSNFREVPAGASEDDPDGRKANPERRRSHLGARPDGTGFHRADFERTYIDGGWNFVGAERCNGETAVGGS